MSRVPSALFALIVAPLACADAFGADGQKIYAGTCQACHATGIANAPRFGNKSAWTARLAIGMDGLLNSVTKGKGAMPAKGGNPRLTEAELRSAVEYMVSAVK